MTSHPKHGRVFYAGTDKPKPKSSPPPKVSKKFAKEEPFTVRREVPIRGIRAGGKTVMACAFREELDKIAYRMPSREESQWAAQMRIANPEIKDLPKTGNPEVLAAELKRAKNVGAGGRPTQIFKRPAKSGAARPRPAQVTPGAVKPKVAKPVMPPVKKLLISK